MICEQRFEALDLLEAPYQWPEIERRAASPEKATTPSWLHGAWVAAATAAAVLVFAGGIVAGRWLLGAGSVLDAALGGSGPLRPATPEDVSVLALVVAGAGGGFVMLTAALTLLWRWRGRNGQSSKMKTRGEVMETMEKTIEKPERTIETVTRNNRWLILAVVVLFAVIVAAGAWLLIDNLVTSDVEHVDAGPTAAMDANDYDAFMALHTIRHRPHDGARWRLASMRARMRPGPGSTGSLTLGTWRPRASGRKRRLGDTYPETVGWHDRGDYEGIARQRDRRRADRGKACSSDGRNCGPVP